MLKEQILSHIDHTQLSPTATWAQIDTLCQEAIKYKTASICIPPCYIAPVAEKYGDSINICTVIGFPLGYSTTETKVFEVKDAIAKGAKEVDMVINQTMVKNGDFDGVTKEIAALKAAAGDKILKVIVETCNLSNEEKIALCKCVTDANADFIKTSTGFGSGGATLGDIRLFADHIGEKVQMKASGGVKTREDLEMFIEAGCTRIGTSSAVKLLSGEEANGY